MTPREIIPQGADHEPVTWSMICTACGHPLVDHPSYYPVGGTPSMPCTVPGCGCAWFSNVCQECGRQRPCPHWPTA